MKIWITKKIIIIAEHPQFIKKIKIVNKDIAFNLTN